MGVNFVIHVQIVNMSGLALVTAVLLIHIVRLNTPINTYAPTKMYVKM